MQADSHRVLVVEHDADTAEMLTMVLRDEGYSADWIGNTPDIVGVVRHHNPELVVIDLLATQSNQYRVLDDLRVDEMTRRIPVLAMTTANAIAEGAMASYNVRGAIAKPFGLDEFLTKVGDALGETPLLAEVPAEIQHGEIQEVAQKILAEHSRAAIFRWVQRLRQEEPWQQRTDLRLSEVLDSVPVLVEALSAAIHYGNVATYFARHPHANDRVRAHATVRYEQGFELDALVKEYGILRDELWQLMWRFMPDNLTKADAAELQRMIDGTLDHIVQVTIPAYIEAAQDKG
jgi:CheY-like chemotaxis protein